MWQCTTGATQRAGGSGGGGGEGGEARCRRACRCRVQACRPQGEGERWAPVRTTSPTSPSFATTHEPNNQLPTEPHPILLACGVSARRPQGKETLAAQHHTVTPP